MRYLGKRKDSQVIQAAWQYSNTRHRPKIRTELLTEQHGFCAYSERYVTPMDAWEIEHFDPRKKNTTDDDYWNWYAVHRRMNQLKMHRSIVDYLPILSPYDPSVSSRIQYEYGQFEPIDAADQAAQNLIDFLGWNEPSLAQERAMHIQRKLNDFSRFFKHDLSGFIEYLSQDPMNFSYITALEAELGVSLTVP